MWAAVTIVVPILQLALSNFLLSGYNDIEEILPFQNL